MRIFWMPPRAATATPATATPLRITRCLAVLLSACTILASTTAAQEQPPPSAPGPKAGVPATEGEAEPPATPPGQDPQARRGDPEDGRSAGSAPAGAASPGPEEAEPSTRSQEAMASARLARVRVANMPLRCFATEHSPLYEDALAEGSAVKVGERYGSFRQVMLPLGPIGYVHKRYASAPDPDSGIAEGTVRTVGRGVSFRYRPKSAEAPVAVLDEGTELWVLGEEVDWWKVRLPGAEAWAPEADLEIFDEPGETLLLAWQELEKTHRRVVEGRVAALAAAAAAEREIAENRAALAKLLERYQQETRKPVQEQDYEALAEDVEAFLAAAPDELKPAVADLEGNIERMRWAVEATMVVREEPVPHQPDPALLEPEKRDSLARFDTIGWLRYHPGRTGPARYTVEKGGQVLFWITCTTNRYDLRLFADKELGLLGPAHRPSPDSMRVLDVERIEVLGVPRE